MWIYVFFISGFLLLECQSLSLSINRDVSQHFEQGQCGMPTITTTTEKPESCKAPTEKHNEVAVITVEDPSSSFFVHFRGDKKKVDSPKNYCGKPIIRKKATGLDSEGYPLKKTIIKRETSNDVRLSRDTSENNQYQKKYEASVNNGSNQALTPEDENIINSDEDMMLALYGSENENGFDNIAHPDYIVRAVSGVFIDQFGGEL